jgi:hypothetical protein
MGIREQLSKFLLRGEVTKLRQAANIFSEAYQMGPAMYSPEQLISRLLEFDSQYVDLIARQMQTTGMMGLIDYDSEDNRIRTVQTSRYLYSSDVLIQSMVDMWTDFGFGLNVSIIPRDEQANEIFQAFWDSPANSYVLNDRYIHQLSVKEEVDGDFLFLFFGNDLTGETIIRVLPTDYVKGGPRGDGVVTETEDSTVPVFYRVERIVNNEPKVIYYRDYRTTDDNLKRAVLPEDGVIATQPATTIRAMLVSFKPRQQFRGWPLLTTGFNWSTVYKDFMVDRANLNRSATMFLDKVTVQGGQRAIDAIATKLTSTLSTGGYAEENPRPVSGSTWLQNQQVDRERFPMGTGAGDAAQDGESLMAMVGLAGRVYPHWLGRGDAFRLATATSMATPVLRAFNRYQLFWSSIWSDVAAWVLGFYAEKKNVTFANTEVDISTDSVLSNSMTDIYQATQTMMQLSPSLSPEEVALSAKQLNRLALQTLGVRDIEEELDDIEPEPEQEAMGDIRESVERVSKALGLN